METAPHLTVCYTGDYDPSYPRHRVIIRGLRENGVNVIERPVSSWWELISVIRGNKKRTDLFFVGYSDSRFVWLARLLTAKPIYWDAFYSLYDNWIFDRKLASPRSLKAAYYWFLDWLCCSAVSAVVLDTNANIAYFRKTFRLARKRFIRVLVGTDDTIFTQRPKDPGTKKFIVEFHGKFIPVQGAEYTVQAANLLRAEREIQFVLIGEGQEFDSVRALAENLNLTNVTFHPSVPYTDLPECIANADICLGLVGNLDRGARAIPNKVYEASAMARPSITMDGPGIRELYTDGENVVLCRGGDPRDLADKIMFLKENQIIRGSIAKNARQLFERYATPNAIGARLHEELETIHHAYNL